VPKKEQHNYALKKGGVKHDADKLRYDLIPPGPMEAVAAVFTAGASKYDDRNWELGMDYGRIYAASQRHLTAYWGGQMYDRDTGIHHLAHAAFGMLALMEYDRLGIGNDTRLRITL